MSITSQPASPGYQWARQPVPSPAWATPAAPQPWAPAPLAPGWPQPVPAPAAGPRRRWLPIALAASAAALAATVGVVATVTHYSPAIADGHAVSAAAPSVAVPPAAPPLVRDESLPALLLDTATVNAVMVSTDLVVNPKLTSAKLFIDTTDKPECGGVWANANQVAYTGSGWQAVQTQYLTEADKPSHEVFQSAVSFPSADAAKEFVTKEGQRWPQCSNTSLTTTNANFAPQTWVITGISQDDDVLTSVSKREGSGGYTCQHALTARNNVVVDAEACGWDIGQQGSTIAHRIAEQITRTL
jgi:serine/threonine kinase PknH